MITWLLLTLPFRKNFLLLYGCFVFFVCVIRIVSVTQQWESARGIQIATAMDIGTSSTLSMECQWRMLNCNVMDLPFVDRVYQNKAIQQQQQQPCIMHLSAQTHWYKFIVSSVNRVSSVWTAALAGSSSHNERVLQFISFRIFCTCTQKNSYPKDNLVQSTNENIDERKKEIPKINRDIYSFFCSCCTAFKLFALSSSF